MRSASTGQLIKSTNTSRTINELTGLTPETTYWLIVEAHTDGGVVTGVSEVSFMTSELLSSGWRRYTFVRVVMLAGCVAKD